MGKLCSKFREDRSTNNVTFLSTDAGRTDGRTDVYVIVYSVQCICTALDRQIIMATPADAQRSTRNPMHGKLSLTIPWLRSSKTVGMSEYSLGAP